MAISAETRAELRFQFPRLLAAMFFGALAAEIVLVICIFIFAGGEGRTLDLWEAIPGMAIGFVTLLVFLCVIGGVPIVLLGVVLILLRAASPLRIVLPPAVLYVLAILWVGSRVEQAAFPLIGIPAVIAGGAVMYWRLRRRGRMLMDPETMF